MAAGPVTPVVELLAAGGWSDISSFAAFAGGDQISISRGRPDESSTADPSTCTLRLNNADGRFSPRNPGSPLYGQVGRNTPLRVVGPAAPGAGAWVVPGSSGMVSAVDFPVLVAGDLDLRVEVQATDLGSTQMLVLFGDPGGELAFGFWFDSFAVTLAWSPDGTAATRTDVDSTAGTPIVPGVTIGLRATLDVDNGAGGHTVTFYAAPTISGPWTQLGAPVTGTGVTSVSPGGAQPWTVGSASDGAAFGLHGVVRAAQILDGIDGPAVADAVFTGRTSDVPFTDAAGLVWSANAGAGFAARDAVRFTGEVSAWPQTWNDTGSDVWATVTASGILRRLGQGQPPAASGLRQVVDTYRAVACWPGDSLLSLPSGLFVSNQPLILNGCAAQVHPGQGNLGSGLPAGLSVDTTNPVLGSTPGNFAPLAGWIGADGLSIGSGSVGGGSQTVACVYAADTLGTVRLFLHASGDLRPGGWMLQLDAPTATIVVYRGDFNVDVGFTLTVLVSVPFPAAFTPGGHSLVWKIFDIGGNLQHEVTVDGADAADVADAVSDQLEGISDFRLTYDPTTVPGGSGLAVGYLSFFNDPNLQLPFSPSAWAQAADGYTAETAGRRIERLCADNDILFTAVGDLDDTMPMGPMGVGDLMSLLREAADTDLGVLFEPRDAIGLGYRTRTSLYNQTPVAVLDYAAGTLAGPPAVTDDDQTVHNDITVTATGGGSARDVQENGPLSVRPPPDGIGDYVTTATVNVASDALLPDQASWRLALGTVDEARWPSLPVSLTNPAVADDPTLTTGLLAADIGDRVTVTNLPAWLPPGDVDQLVQGYTETLAADTWNLDITGAPASPYQVAVYGVDRYDTEAATTQIGFSPTDTTLTITSAAGTQPWTTDPAAFPFDILIGGERMTVTAITSTTSPQTFVVVRSVNGVFRDHPSAGEPVRLARTPRYAL